MKRAHVVISDILLILLLVLHFTDKPKEETVIMEYHLEIINADHVNIGDTFDIMLSDNSGFTDLGYDAKIIEIYEDYYVIRVPLVIDTMLKTGSINFIVIGD